MAVLLGDKRRFAAEVGDWAGPALRRVDLWVADQWLTCDDNMAFVNQFRSAVQETAVWLRGGRGSHLPFPGLSPEATHRRLTAGTGNEEEDDMLRRRFRLFDRWGPTTDNVLAFLFRDAGDALITVQFWREGHLRTCPEHVGTVFVAEVRAVELAGMLDDLVTALGNDQHLAAIG